MTQQPYELSAIESARRIARGELTSEALVISCLDRIAAREDAVHAWAFLDPEYAVKQARAIDREAAQLAARRPRRHQGRYRHLRHADRIQFSNLPRTSTKIRLCLRDPFAEGWLRALGKDRNNGVRLQSPIVHP